VKCPSQRGGAAVADGAIRRGGYAAAGSDPLRATTSKADAQSKGYWWCSVGFAVIRRSGGARTCPPRRSAAPRRPATGTCGQTPAGCQTWCLRHARRPAAAALTTWRRRGRRCLTQKAAAPRAACEGEDCGRQISRNFGALLSAVMRLESERRCIWGGVGTCGPDGPGDQAPVATRPHSMQLWASCPPLLSQAQFVTHQPLWRDPKRYHRPPLLNSCGKPCSCTHTRAHVRGGGCRLLSRLAVSTARTCNADAASLGLDSANVHARQLAPTSCRCRAAPHPPSRPFAPTAGAPVGGA
jgi:hypothetical protein